MTTQGAGRIYGGVSAADRQKLRRSALVEAGLELFGTEGYPNVSVKKICDEACLTQRYFYESFADRVELLAAVYEHCVDIGRSATIAAAADVLGRMEIEGDAVPAVAIPALAEEALGAFISALVDDPRRARVILIEVVGVAPEIEKLRLGAIHDWADLIAGFACGGRPPTPAQKLAAIGMVGAITQLLVDWQTAMSAPISDEAGPDLFNVEAIHRVVTDIFIASYNRIFRP
ncbi:TetR/AcrR family transcriptional regulator [Gordonia shandongensis]|uniref:TetR/AcrR family transcriptional regulator n=1 Tax=Gordonia shandongensis TaxID=376351 RepID=UPI00047CD691|nr:TetR/AcrR family transcriptional regulator [Gordonia shandongensis]